MEMIGVECVGEPRRNAKSIADSIDCWKVEIRLVAVFEKEKELGIGTEVSVVRSIEVIKCALWMELMPGTELSGRRNAYHGRPTRRGDYLCISSGFSTRRAMELRLIDSCQWTSCSRRVVMKEGSLRSRSRNPIASA
jgi:hypothetical protein